MSKQRRAVYLGQIAVENLLCFGPQQTLDLTLPDGRPARWTLILGDNGLGKTTLLQAITAVGSCLYENRAGQRQRAGLRKLALTWLNANMNSLPSVETSRQQVLESQFLIGEQPAGLHGIFSHARAEVTLSGPIHSTTGPDARADWFRDYACFGYGASRRPGSAVVLADDAHEDNAATLFDDDARLVNPEEWLLQTDYAAARAKGENKVRWQQRFELVKATLIDLLPDVEAIRIRGPEGDQSRPVALFQTPFGEVPFGRLGLGYRTMIAWVVDLAARMFRRWPDSDNPLAEPAVVLVDEIDLHLHPAWQRHLPGWLTERFVNTQFIATAHSPLVVQAATDARIAVLRRDGDHVCIDQSQEGVTGWRVDQLLTSDLFGLPTARPARFDALLAERQALLSKPVLSAADRARLTSLAADVAELPTADTAADIAAMDVIRRAAEVLKPTEGA